MAPTDEERTLELECRQLGVERARSDYGASREKYSRGTLVLTPSHLVLFDSDGRQSQRFERASVIRGWFAPGFEYAPIALPMLKSRDEAVLYAPQLILELQSKQWIVASVDRDEAYELLDALAIGPRQRMMAARLFLPKSVPWLRNGATPVAVSALLGGMIGWVLPSIIGAFFWLMMTSSSAPSFLQFATTAGGLWATIVLIRWLMGFVRVECSRSALMLPERAHPAPISIETIERVEFNVYGANLYKRGRETPIIAEVRAFSPSANPTDEVCVDVLRLGHAVIDWALAIAEQREKFKSLLESARASLPESTGEARLGASKALLLGDGYRVAPADERALVALATDADSSPSDSACAAEAIIASGSAESRARVLAYRKK